MVSSPFRVLSLCSGVGCLDIGVRLAVPGARTVGYVEGEAFAVSVLVDQMEQGSLDPAPVFPDLCSFDAVRWADAVDCVVAGFPCQGQSLAGKRLAQKDPRWLWPHVQRVIRDSGAGWAFLENVPGLRTAGLDSVLEGLAEIGFDAEWTHLSAEAVGAPHRRNRWWCLATNSKRATVREQPRGGSWPNRQGAAQSGLDGQERAAANSNRRGQPQQPQQHGERREGQHGESWQHPVRHRVGDPFGPGSPERQSQSGDPRPELAPIERAGRRAAEPDVGLVVDGPAAWMGGEPLERTVGGFPGRVDALRALGNGVVPQQAAEAFRILMARYGEEWA